MSRYEDSMRAAVYSLVGMVVLLLLAMLTSCKTMYVTVPEYHKEYINRTDTIIKIARKSELLALTTQAEDNLNDASLAMRIEFDADRSLISTFHDGEHTSGGYDMTKMDECYEKVCEERNIVRITGYSRDESGRYKNIPTKDLQIYRYLRNNNHCFVGTVDEIRRIDPDYAARMDETKMCYAAMYYINNGDIPLSIFSVSWRKGNEKYIPEESVLRRRLAEIAKDIKPHLMVGAYYPISN